MTVALEWDEGGIIFERIAAGLYEGHWLFLPHTKDVLGKGREAIAYLFTHTDATKIVGKTPTSNKHAIRAAKAVGMREVFVCRGISFTELSRRHWNTDKEV